MASKPIKAVVKLQIDAGKANPAPPIGTALGPQGINLMNFCKEFNAATAQMAGDVIPAVITIYEDRTFSFILKTPPASALLKKLAKVEKGAANSLTTKVGKVTKAQLRAIAEQKLVDLNTTDIEKAMKTIAGTAKNMGIEISE